MKVSEEISKVFKERCGKYPYHKQACNLCRYGSSNGVSDRDACMSQYAIDIHTGKMKLEDSFLKDDGADVSPDKNKFPSLEAVAEDFRQYCGAMMSCQGCYLYSETIPCALRFAYEVLTEGGGNESK